MYISNVDIYVYIFIYLYIYIYRLFIYVYVTDTLPEALSLGGFAKRHAGADLEEDAEAAPSCK